MNCPHCNQPIPDALIASEAASRANRMRSTTKNAGRPREAQTQLWRIRSRRSVLDVG